MKKYKFNFSLIHFILLFAIITFLASCGKEKIEKNTDSLESDNTLIESKYEQTETTPEEFYSQFSEKEIKFENFQHKTFKFDEHVKPQIITLNGNLDLTNEKYPSGKLNISSIDLELDAQLRIDNGIFYYQDTDSKLWIDPFNIEVIHQTDGGQIDFFNTSDNLLNALNNDQVLNSAQKAVLSMIALGSTDQFLIARDRIKQNNGLKSISCSWYDYFIAGAVAAPIALAAAAGCSALTASCAGVTAITLGGFSVPCAVLITGCYGGAIFSTAGAYSYVLNNWLCDVITCVFQSPSPVWSGNPSNNSVRLNWQARSGADRYQVVQWTNSGWLPLVETTSTYRYLNNMTPGVTYYFGVRTVCGNTATYHPNWTTVFN